MAQGLEDEILRQLQIHRRSGQSLDSSRPGCQDRLPSAAGTGGILEQSQQQFEGLTQLLAHGEFGIPVRDQGSRRIAEGCPRIQPQPRIDLRGSPVEGIAFEEAL